MADDGRWLTGEVPWKIYTPEVLNAGNGSKKVTFSKRIVFQLSWLSGANSLFKLLGVYNDEYECKVVFA